MAKVVTDKFSELSETVRKSLETARKARDEIRLKKGEFLITIMESLILQNQEKCWFKQIPMAEYVGCGQGTISKAKTFLVKYSENELEGSKNHADNWQQALAAAQDAQSRRELVKFMDKYTSYDSTPNSGKGNAATQDKVAQAANKSINTDDVDEAIKEIHAHLNAVYAAVNKLELDLDENQVRQLIGLVDKVRAKLDRAPALKKPDDKGQGLRPAASQ